MLVLIARHYKPDLVFQAHQLLDQVCQLLDPKVHKNSVLRSAGEAYAVDLLNTMDMLINEKRAPRYLIPSEQLGKVPLGALSIRDEVSVSARLESLEENLRKVCTLFEKQQGGGQPTADTASKLDGLEKKLETLNTKLSQMMTPAPSFANVASAQGPGLPSIAVTPPGQVAHGGQDGAGALGTGVGGRRPRLGSNSVKRKVEETHQEDAEGFKKPGRPRQRKTASGSSQVQVADVGEYIAGAEFYIGNTDGRTNAETIKTVLTRCAAAVDGGIDLVVDKVELLTKERDPRTKCWKVAVPFRFKSIMEKDEVYPAGWKHRTFFGSRNTKEKRPRLDQANGIEQQVLNEQQQEAEKAKHVNHLDVDVERRNQLLEDRMSGQSAQTMNS